ncbi:MAG: hypothetical protein ABR976_04720 [Terracidiphilus sp.]
MMGQRKQHRRASFVQAGALCLLLGIPAFGQNHANVSVDLGTAVNPLTDTSLGSPAPMFDANSFNPASLPYLRVAGVSAARYPGNHGVADLYHWSTKTTTHYKGSDAGYIAPESNFGNFAQFVDKLGQAVIVVNYGTNLDGTGGGEPAEAAAWVAYANGDPASTQAIGKDSTGEDWHTAGYWANLRSQAPLASDDGLNFLRIAHPKPFGFRLWQVGDEVYNNGFYGGDHTGTPDLHGSAPTGPKDLGKLHNDPKLSPSAFADNLKAFAQAMKAVDPSIEIGAALTMPASPDPNNHDWVPDWNHAVLKGACASLDFVTFDWSRQLLLPPDWKTLDEAGLLSNEGYQQANVIGLLINSIQEDYKKFCPANHTPRFAFAPAGIATWMGVEHPVVKALWVADFYAQLIESGSVNINWNEMYGDSMLSADRKKFGPAFYGLQMLHILAHSPGDRFLAVNSSTRMVGAHATFRRDGFVGLMLVNKDPKSPVAVKVTFKNGNVGAAGKRIDYGSEQFGAGAATAATPFSATGNEFTVTVPPYTITDILLPRQN